MDISKRWVGSTIPEGFQKKRLCRFREQSGTIHCLGPLVLATPRTGQASVRNHLRVAAPTMDKSALVDSPSSAPGDCDLNKKYTRRMHCWDNKIVHMAEISSAISAASLTTWTAAKRKRGMWLDIKFQTEFFHKKKRICCNTSFVPLAFYVITYEASLSKDIYFYF